MDFKGNIFVRTICSLSFVVIAVVFRELENQKMPAGIELWAGYAMKIVEPHGQVLSLVGGHMEIYLTLNGTLGKKVNTRAGVP